MSNNVTMATIAKKSPRKEHAIREAFRRHLCGAHSEHHSPGGICQYDAGDRMGQ